MWFNVLELSQAGLEAKIEPRSTFHSTQAQAFIHNHLFNIWYSNRMRSYDKRKYFLFAFIVVLFLVFTAIGPYKNRTFQLLGRSPFITKSTTEETALQKDQSTFSFSLPSFFSDDEDDADRITNENCGISFILPEGWIVTDLEEGNRYCLYYIKNPNVRGGTLEVGVPRFTYPSEEVEWNELIMKMKLKFKLTPSSVSNADESFTIERTVFPPTDSDELIGISDPMYIFRKGQAAYYMRYGYPDDDGRNMLDDIASVISSVTFPQPSSFYEEPLRSNP